MPPIPDDQRLVTVVLCDASGVLLGQLAAFLVAPQFWPEVAAVVDHVRQCDGLEVTVLRLLTTDGGYAGGPVSYLAQLRSGDPGRLGLVAPPAAAAVAVDPAYRQWWAEPDALADLPAWVDAALARRGRRRTGPLRQVKTWNLSMLMRAATLEGEVWLKATPPFLADEGGVITRVAALDDRLTPRVLDHDPARRLLLMDHVPGTDQWGLTDPAVVAAMTERWVAVQRASTTDLEHLLSLGAVDLRPSALLRSVEAAATRPETRSHLTTAERDALDALVAALPGRLSEVSACGLPDTLVHGDLHPGNWRRDGDRLTLLDWGDVGVGHPVFDMRAFVERLDGAAAQSRTRAGWVARWRAAVPGSDPERAARLLAPVAELVAAATYQRFLDHIEETERVYHRHDPVDRFRAALAATDGTP
ncbi:MAG: aminoglycoside phosphotransferase family protein [Lapillicoccus sp.]